MIKVWSALDGGYFGYLGNALICQQLWLGVSQASSLLLYLCICDIWSNSSSSSSCWYERATEGTAFSLSHGIFFIRLSDADKKTSQQPPANHRSLPVGKWLLEIEQSASSLLLVVVFRYEHCGSLLVRCHPNYMPSSSETSMQTMGNHGNLIVGRTIARWYVVPFDASLWIISLSNFLLTSWGIYLFFSLLRGHSLISRLACLSNRFYRTC